MIPRHVVETLNDVRFGFKDALERLPEIPSFRALIQSSDELRHVVDRLLRVTEGRHLKEPCDGRLTCAIIGSSGHGKTTVLDEMFPSLSERGWLVTDVTDTTAQSLRIEYAEAGSKEIDEVTVSSWSVPQLKELMSHEEVAGQNEKHGIRVNYGEKSVVVDGTEATFPKEDLANFRFQKFVTLEPFTEPYRVPREKSKDPRFIRSLTVKEQSSVMETGPILTAEGKAYDALQLRALVKDVGLKDAYERLSSWAQDQAEEVKALTFVDTPGLAVAGSVKDEMLRYFLEKKSDHIALQLWKNDELDLVVHLVLCGRQSDFATLWKSVERECGPREMENLAERLILAVNGMNIYFTNRDIRAKYDDKSAAAREGDHFASTLEDNILQKMSPRGRVKPARICFVDSKSIVETLTTGTYEEAYLRYRPIMEKWLTPGEPGYAGLASLGLIERFRENMEALADASDRGQGYLVRQILEVARERGPALLVRKHLVKSGLMGGLTELEESLRRWYDVHGNLNREAVQTALKGCLQFLDRDDPAAIEALATHMDPRCDEIVGSIDEHPDEETWALGCFEDMAALLLDTLLGQSAVAPEIEAEFRRHFDVRAAMWAERWGWAEARMESPEVGFTSSSTLVLHCLKVAWREIVHQLLSDNQDDGGAAIRQSKEDREAVHEILRMIEDASATAESLCRETGVAP